MTSADRAKEKHILETWDQANDEFIKQPTEKNWRRLISLDRALGDARKANGGYPWDYRGPR